MRLGCLFQTNRLEKTVRVRKTLLPKAARGGPPLLAPNGAAHPQLSTASIAPLGSTATRHWRVSQRSARLMQTEHPIPTWPSLYNFLIEIEPIAGKPPVQPSGHYLYNANGQGLLNIESERLLISWPADIYRFTLYWTLVFYTPAFFICGLYAFLNLTFTQQSRVRRFLRLAPSKYTAVPTRSDMPLKAVRNMLSPDAPNAGYMPGRSRAKHNERRSRLTFSIIVAFTFAVCAVGGAVVGSAVTGYVMAGLFKVARYNMST